jgi:nucleoside-diphosphate-sugar epimerase
MINRTPRLLLTGATGFIGQHLLPLLVESGFEVHAVARTIPAAAVKGVRWHPADLLAPGAAGSLARSVAATHLVHLAWNVTPGQFWTAGDNLDWVAASLALYRGFAESGGRRAVFVGTCAEYDWRYDQLDEALTPCEPRTLYGVAKHALHGLLGAAAQADGVSLAWARLFFLYGAGEPRARLVPDVITSILQDRPAPCGDGRAERDFMYIADVAEALMAILNSDYAGPVNVASGNCIPLRDVIEMAANQLGRPDLVRLGARPTPADEPSRLKAVTRTLNDVIGFAPRMTLRDGLHRSIDWWRHELGRAEVAENFR